MTADKFIGSPLLWYMAMNKFLVFIILLNCFFFIAVGKRYDAESYFPFLSIAIS